MPTTSHLVRPDRLRATLQLTALGCIALAASRSAAPLAAQSPGRGAGRLVVEAVMDGGRDAPHLVAGTPEKVALEADPDRPALWSAAFGDAGRVTVVYAGPERATRLRLDLDGDGEAELDTSADPKPVGRSVRWEYPDTLQREITPLEIWLRLMPASAAPALLVTPAPPHYLHGTVKVAGQQVVVMLADLDIDGVFGSERDGWRVLPTADMDRLLARDDRFRFSKWTMMRVDEPCFVGDEVLSFESVEGRAIQLSTTTGGDDLSSFLSRRHQRFNAEWRERMGERWSAGRDPESPRTERPVEWLDVVDLAPALVRASQLDLPIFLQLEAGESLLTHRLDEAVYADPAVAEALRERFVPVRLHIELATDDVLARYGLKALPAMPVLLPSGAQLQTEGGPVVFKPSRRHANSPGFYASRLQAAHQIWTDR